MTVIAVKELTGRHVLFALFGFFGMMLVANGIFVYYALETFHGVDDPNAYQDGLSYNQRIEAERRQDALGWSHALTLSDGGRVMLTFNDKAGNPVSGLTVAGTLGRPVDDSFTHKLALKESGTGVYSARIEGLGAGTWIVSLEASKLRGEGSETLYRIKERLWLKPNS